jgi:hypothetical protein
LDDRSIARELARVAGAISTLDEKRRRLIERYAEEEMAGEAYIAANRALDRDLERLTREKAELAAALQSPQHEDFVDASVRQFCASARARFQACADFDAKRQFLPGHVDRVIYHRYKITIAGSVPVQSASGDSRLQFRIEGEIDRKVVRSRARAIGPEVRGGRVAGNWRPLTWRRGLSMEVWKERAMTEELVKRIPTGLLGAALLVLGIIIIVQRFVFGLPLYDDSGTILPVMVTPSDRATSVVELDSRCAPSSVTESSSPSVRAISCRGDGVPWEV